MVLKINANMLKNSTKSNDFLKTKDIILVKNLQGLRIKLFQEISGIICRMFMGRWMIKHSKDIKNLY